MTEQRSRPLLSEIATAGLFGLALGGLDFILFDLVRGDGIREEILYGSGLSGLSYLASQLVAVWGLTVLCQLLFRLLMMAAPWPFPRFRPISAARLALATVGCVMIALRLITNRTQVPEIAVFALALILLLVVTREGRDPSLSPRPSSRSAVYRAAWSLLALSIPILIPAGYASWRRSLPRPAPTDQRPNVVLIVLDTLRADALSCYGASSYSTPNIDRVAGEGLLFLNALSAAPWTLPSHSSMWTGLYPSQHHADWEHQYLDSSFVTLAETLREDGYRTVGITENPVTARALGLAAGFDEYHEMWRRPLLVKAIARIGERALGMAASHQYAPRTVACLRQWLENHGTSGEPFFAFLNFMAAHLPNRPHTRAAARRWTAVDLAAIEVINRVPERYYLPRDRLNDRQLVIMRELYGEEVAYLDGYIGALLDVLREQGILDQTIVVITSDHGENFGDHGLIEHQFCLYNSLLHVPLIIRYPGVLAPQRLAQRFSTVNLRRVILSLVEPRGAVAGTAPRNHDIVSLAAENAQFAEYGNPIGMLRNVLGREIDEVDTTRLCRRLRCIIVDHYKLIEGSDGRAELYDLGDDFAETVNLVESRPRLAEELIRSLEQWHASLSSTPSPEAAPTMDRETLDALRALGYVR